MRRLARWSFLASLVSLTSVATLTSACSPKAAAVSPGPPAFSADADRTWTELTSTLPGTWTAKNERGTVITESFRLVSGGSALVETFTVGGGHETLSVYHRDRGSLLMTHYCAQGNQPRLRAGGTDASGVTHFRFVDVTDLGGDEEVMVERSFQVHPTGDVDSVPMELVQTEVYKRPDGTLDTTMLHFARARTA